MFGNRAILFGYPNWSWGLGADRAHLPDGHGNGSIGLINMAIGSLRLKKLQQWRNAFRSLGFSHDVK